MMPVIFVDVQLGVRKNKLKFISTFLINILLFLPSAIAQDIQIDSRYLYHRVDLNKQDLRFFLKNDNKEKFLNFENLKSFLEASDRKLVFAMNGGMFDKDYSPQGLYVEEGEIITEIDTTLNGYGNFYLQPNGVLYITKNDKAVICNSQSFVYDDDIQFATQSGPMLLIDGHYHSMLNKGSLNLHIRNGVGILPDGALLFAMSKVKINFYDFASFFKRNGCKDALYLDGFVSRAYLPSKNWIQKDGSFGVIIAEIDNLK